MVNHIGEEYGKLLIVGRVQSNDGETAWRCLCDCGREVIRTIDELQKGTPQCARCAAKAHDLTGIRFGKLKVIERVDGGKYRGQWICRCGCGRTRIASTESLIDDQVTSCGCCVDEWRDAL